jgi:hypothetical protein
MTSPGANAGTRSEINHYCRVSAAQNLTANEAPMSGKSAFSGCRKTPQMLHGMIY